MNPSAHAAKPKHPSRSHWRALICAALLGLASLPTLAPAQTAAQEAAIRKNLNDRLPGMPKIDEVRRTPMAGLFEVRMGNEIVYTDADGSHLIQGQLVDTRTRRDLTQDRLDKLNAIAFDSLPIKDAITIVRGNGKRKLALFEDPNCGYCKRFERDLQKVNDVTIYLFLMPILGAESTEQSRNVWCAKDKARAWADLMVADKPIPAAAPGCDSSALTRNVEFGRKMRITGTPTLVFANGNRVPGAINSAQVEKFLTETQTP
jgi:thiol:disulfide interchange protein DsbC